MDTLTSPPNHSSERPVPPSAAVLHIRIAVKELGIDTAQVLGICAGIEPDRSTDTVSDVVGALGFEGRPVPVVDLRLRYGLPVASPGPKSRTLVLDIDGERVGLVVDEVVGRIDLRDAELRPSPGCNAVDGRDCITGLCRRERDGVGHEVILVDIGRLIGSDTITRPAAPTRPGNQPARSSRPPTMHAPETSLAPTTNASAA